MYDMLTFLPKAQEELFQINCLL